MTQAPRHPAAIAVGDTLYLRDAKGALVPIEAIKASDLLMDEQVRTLLVKARAVADAIAAFKAEARGAVGALQELLAQQYGATIGGRKGNVSLLTFDGCQKVQVQVADRMEFGPELQAAKLLVDECLIEWASGGSVELKAIVSRAFAVDNQGQINRSGLLMLLRTESADPRWKRAMDAIRDSIRVVGAREYIRFYHRPAGDAPWLPVSLDIATA